MRQLRFYIPYFLDIDQKYDVPENTARHMVRVLRLKDGDEVMLFNGDDCEYRGRLTGTTKKSVKVFVFQKTLLSRESTLNTHLIQALSKGDKMETTIQKVVELGVNVISPVRSERSNVNLSGTRLEKKMQHWQGVVESACEQTGRNRLPELRQLSSFTSTLNSYKDMVGLKLILSPRATSALMEIDERPENVVILIGPEGGLSESEMRYAQDCGFVSVKVGPRVLRTETAGPAVLSMVQMRWGDLG